MHREAPVVQAHGVPLDVLQQRTAMEYVEELHSAADRQHRQIAIQRLPQQALLHLIALRVGFLRVRAGSLSIQRRIDIRSAREHKARETIQRF